jgi:hypothetical protein
MTTFTSHHLVPEGRAILACTCLLPDGWVQVPPPDEEYDLDNPAVFIPIVVCMAPYGAVVFTVAARPAFDDGSVQDWAEYLATQNEVSVTSVREARINRMPCVLVDGTMQSEMGVMRSRSVFLEDGRRLFNIGTLAPDALWSSVEHDFAQLLGAFSLDDVQGITAAPMRLMTSDPAIDLTDIASVARAAAAPTAAPAPVAHEEDSAADVPDAAPSDVAAPDDQPAKAADVALADDTVTLDPEHPVNARLRDNGVGLVPNVLEVVAEEKYAVIGAGAIESLFHVPFGWHVIDNGKRTLVFDVAGGVQINFSLRQYTPNDLGGLLSSIGAELARENPDAQFLTFDLLGFPCLAVRDLLVDGEQLDQAYLARPSHHDELALVCRVTATRAEITRAVNAAEVMMRSLRPVMAQAATGHAGDASDREPSWWRDAVRLELNDRLDEAEQTILSAIDHIGVYSQIAYLYELRYARLRAANRLDEAKAAKQRAIEWLYRYASSATSGGEGAALSQERDQRIRALGGED